MVQEWKRIRIFFCVEIIGILFSTFDNIFSLIVKFLQDFGGLRLEDLGGKMVSIMGYNSNVFPRSSNQCHIAIQEKHCLFF